MRMVFYFLLVIGSLAYHLWNGVKIDSASEELPLASLGFDVEKVLSFPDKKTNKRVLRELANVTDIAQVSIPEPAANEGEWRAFLTNILSLHEQYQIQTSRRRTITQHSPFIGFVAYLAKYQPKMAMEWVDQGILDVSSFNHLIQSGYLKDWHSLSRSPNQLVRSSQLGLLRVAINQGVESAERIAKNAFLTMDLEDSGEIGKKAISLVNLRFAMDSMSEGQIQNVVDRILSKHLRINLNEIVQMRGILPNDTILNIIEIHGNPKANRQAYAFDAASLGDVATVEEVLVDYAFYLGDESKFRNNVNRHFASCPICVLAINTDGLILSNKQAKRLNYRPTKLDVVKRGDGTIIIKEWLDVEEVSNAIK